MQSCNVFDPNYDYLIWVDWNMSVVKLVSRQTSKRMVILSLHLVILSFQLVLIDVITSPTAVVLFYAVSSTTKTVAEGRITVQALVRDLPTCRGNALAYQKRSLEALPTRHVCCERLFLVMYTIKSLALSGRIDTLASES